MVTTDKPVCEACRDAAKVCEGEFLPDPPHDSPSDNAYDVGVRHCAAAIRAACKHAQAKPDLDLLCAIAHLSYEMAAKDAGWETQKASRVAWDDLPEPNKQAMRAAISAVCDEIDAQATPLSRAPSPETGQPERASGSSAQPLGHEFVERDDTSCGKSWWTDHGDFVCGQSSAAHLPGPAAPSALEEK